MASNSRIEWTEMTWNPVTGCSRISVGCINCYAERMAKRLQAMGVQRYINAFQVTLHEDLLELPLKWKQPRMIFVNSMSDLFHEDVPLDFIKATFDTMRRCPQHTFQVLTKRSQRLKEVAGSLQWSENVWMGVSVENSSVTYRISDLVTVPSIVHFLSCEPLLGEIPILPLAGIDWVIVGGESGPYARPMLNEWVEIIFQQCRENAVPFFFKQWGGTRKNITGRMLHERTYDEMPLISQLQDV